MMSLSCLFGHTVFFSITVKQEWISFLRNITFKNKIKYKEKTKDHDDGTASHLDPDLQFFSKIHQNTQMHRVVCPGAAKQFLTKSNND